MEESKQPKTLEKVGIFIRDLEEALKRFDSDIQQIPIGIVDIYKYAVYREKPAPYFLMISQKQEIAFEEHNISLTITSDSDELNQKIYKKFRQKTGINSKDAQPTPYLEIEYLGTELLGISFLAFKKSGEKAVMDSLKKSNK